MDLHQVILGISKKCVNFKDQFLTVAFIPVNIWVTKSVRPRRTSRVIAGKVGRLSLIVQCSMYLHFQSITMILN